MSAFAVHPNGAWGLLWLLWRLYALYFVVMLYPFLRLNAAARAVLCWSDVWNLLIRYQRGRVWVGRVG